jgi:CRP/FNR family transcriptional regulator
MRATRRFRNKAHRSRREMVRSGVRNTAFPDLNCRKYRSLELIMSANTALAKADTLVMPQCGLASQVVRTVARNEMLFEAGDAKACVYRIVSGIVYLYGARPGGRTEAIEFAFSGDLVGIGFLPTHVTSARAIADTQVVCLPMSAADHVDPCDDRSATRLKNALKREFEHRREELRAFGRGRPAVRVAAFLLTLSRRNRIEGRDPHVIDHAADCFEVADHVSLSVNDLGVVLAELKEQGVLGLTPSGASRIVDIEALEGVANGQATALKPVAVQDGAHPAYDARERLRNAARDLNWSSEVSP